MGKAKMKRGSVSSCHQFYDFSPFKQADYTGQRGYVITNEGNTFFKIITEFHTKVNSIYGVVSVISQTITLPGFLIHLLH
jgi:hypothetical protein